MGRALLIMDSDFNRRKAIEWIGKAPEGARIEFKASKRTLPQNDLMWALLTEVSEQLDHAGKRYDPDQWKAIFLHAFGREISFLPSLDQKTFLPIELSSSDLSKDEMTDFIEFIMKEGSDRGVVFRQHTNDNSNPAGNAPSDPAVDDADPPSASEGDEVSPASSPSTLSQADLDWLIIVARMLWAATPNTSQTEDNLHLLNAQRLAIPVPEEVSRLARDKAGSIYTRCKQCLMGEHPRAETLKYIAGVAGCTETQITETK